MISIFRKIRQQLLTENRVTRYLIYALGEILLVTIGILIALQMNTWKEEKQHRLSEQTFYQTILDDLENDQKKLDQLSKFYQSRIDNLSWLLTHVRDPSLGVSPSEFGRHTEPLYYNESAISFDATYEAAKSGGAFEKYSNKELLKKLVEYYSNFKQIEDVLTATLRFLESSFEPLMSSVPNDFLNSSTSQQVLTSEGNKGFYSLLDSIPDQRKLATQKEIDAFLQKTEFESYLIGDLGRSFNMTNELELRSAQIKSLQEEIKSFIHD
ncbi:DUF6090 family protein [Algoriphagus sp.]|uniref:DUF6090 family protein n=1 Tax=Algoriphagus sp. TaxID=1872435 RepID=UPI0025CC84B5|nr:DUF6090 family protein [Algoriphagus sp.]